MVDRLSFYLKRSNWFYSLNPITKLTFIFCLLVTIYSSRNIYPPIYFSILVIILSFLAQIGKEFLKSVMKIALPTAGILFLMQSFMMQLGNSSIFEFFIFKLTIENISYAGISAARIFLMLISFLLFILSTHPSELMTDLTRRGLPGQLAYVVVSTLQILPQMQAKAAAIISAQRSRGLDTEGSLAKRVGALAPLVGPLVFGSLVEVEERAIAIEARAFMSTLKKTSLKEVADTRLDKTLRIALIAITVGAFLWR